MKELAFVFLRLGTTAFGGPAAHIGMMEHEFVRRRQWLTREQFLDLVGAAGLIPGPSSTEVAIYVGYRRAGWRGLVVAGACFILPAAIMVTAIAWAYVRFGRLPAVGGALYGVKAVIIAVIAQALAAFGKAAITTKWLLLVGIAAAIANSLGASPIAVLVMAGAASALSRASRPTAGRASWILPGAFGTSATLSAPIASGKLFLIFLKIGAVVFGSGYVLLAFLRADLVERTRWLTESQLTDAIAVGQFTPGPVFTTATFIGYVVAGTWGAVVATVGIFLPSFFLVAASGPLIPRLRRLPVFAAFLDGDDDDEKPEYHRHRDGEGISRREVRGPQEEPMTRKVDAFLEREETWRAEFKKLRGLLLDSGLNEELKWGKPCYAIDGKNVALIHGFKDYCAILFTKGALLQDPQGVLVQQTKNVQAARQIRFTSLAAVTKLEKTIKAYIRKAIEIERAGLTVPLKKTEEFELPEELESKLASKPKLKAAFRALTPGRQRGYILHFSQAKLSATRAARVEKHIPRILAGLGLDD